eukprot:7953114-Alexandrium_andersonii.AAC.1
MYTCTGHAAGFTEKPQHPSSARGQWAWGLTSLVEDLPLGEAKKEQAARHASARGPSLSRTGRR